MFEVKVVVMEDGAVRCTVVLIAYTKHIFFADNMYPPFLAIMKKL